MTTDELIQEYEKIMNIVLSEKERMIFRYAYFVGKLHLDYEAPDKETKEKIIERIEVDFGDNNIAVYSASKGFSINFAELHQVGLKGFQVKGENNLIFIPAQRVINVFFKDIMNKIEVSNCLNCTLRYVDSVENYCALTNAPLPYNTVVERKTFDWCPLLKDDYQITHKDKEQK